MCGRLTKASLVGTMRPIMRNELHVVRPIEREDNASVARLIRAVMPEFGASGPGYAIMDPEVDDMFGAYNAHGARASYWVVVERASGAIAGGGGFAPLEGGDMATCELRKMYFYPAVRGLGFGSKLITLCIEGAAQAGFARMYLETLTGMHKARALYERQGFRALAAPLGNTGHAGCNSFYLRDL